MTIYPPEYVLNLITTLQVVAADQAHFDGDQGDGITTSRWSYLHALEMLACRQREGLPGALRRSESAQGVLDMLKLGTLNPRSSGQPVSMEEADEAVYAMLSRAEATLGAEGTVLEAAQFRSLCSWETGASDTSAASGESAVIENQIDAARLTAYLRQHCEDPALTISNFRRLGGGFHKETFIFDAEGKTLTGELVMRRDTIRPLIDSACHRVHREFEVLRALQMRGFPSPHVLWVDTEHPSLPGGNFIIMRRSEGVCGGTLFGANQPIDDAVSDQMGAMLAQLHSLAPLRELGALTESIRPDMWNKPAAELVKDYLLGFRTLLLSNRHAPSLATIAVLNWLLANIPVTSAVPCLIHGDVGFHNILMSHGRLTTLLDWERAHIGHPGEDIAYLYNAGAADLNWPRVMSAYAAGGGKPMSEKDLMFFRIMMLARNAVSINVGTSRLFTGDVTYIRLVAAERFMRPKVIAGLSTLMSEYSAKFSTP